MRVIKKLETIMVPAGKYWIGDPCYSVPDEDWDDLLLTCDYFQGSAVGTCPNGAKVLGFGTAYGDGEYFDGNGRGYPVDAGLIGLVPVIEGWNREDSGVGKEDGVYLIEFTKDTLCASSQDGRYLKFGDLVIDTDPEEADEEDEY